jgi:hypothetical protein
MLPIVFIIGWCIFVVLYENRYERRFNQRRRKRLGLK